MSRPSSASLNLGGTRLPVDFVTESSAILGKKGSGKTTAGIVLFEEVYALGVPVVSIDPKGDHWGLRAGANGTPRGGLPVVVFGGLHGDVPLTPESGRYLADLLRGKNLSAVLDVSEFSTGERRRFLAAFVDRLYRRSEREPMHLIIEEAHEVIPQRFDSGDAPMVGAFERLVKLGRFKGIGVTMLSQRSASLNKNVLTQVDNLFMLRTVSPQDRAAVKAWIETHSESSTIIDSLPGLATGECWLWQPERGEPVNFRFRTRHTYDAGTTPKVGERLRPPATLAGVDLAAIQSEMAATIEAAKQDDPTVLRAQIVKLRRELAQAGATAPAPVVRETTVQVPVVGSQELATIRQQLTVAEQQIAAFKAQIDDQVASLGLVIDGVYARTVAVEAGNDPVRTQPVVTAAVPPVRTAQAAPSAVPVTGPDETKLRSGAKRMVEALGRMQPLRLTKSQWGMVSGLKTTGGTWSTYLGELRRLGFIDESDAGYALTDAGFDYLGGRPAPMTAAELQQHYRKILRSGAVRMLDEIMARYPGGITKQDLSVASGIASTGGTFSTYLGDLTRNGLIERRGGTLVATGLLMHGAETSPQ